MRKIVRKPEETIWETQKEVDDDNIEIELKYIGVEGLELTHPF